MSDGGYRLHESSKREAPAYAVSSRSAPQRLGQTRLQELGAAKSRARQLIMGNWKSAKTAAEAKDFFARFSLSGSVRARVDTVIFPPLTLLSLLQACMGDQPDIQALGAQTVSAHGQGAHTGEVTADQLKDVGMTYALVGHSERRRDNGETDEIVSEKIQRCFENALVPVLCIGESLEERQGHRTDVVLRRQIKGALGASIVDSRQKSLVLAYEPVWAIGTGLVPSQDQLVEAADTIRRCLREIYGIAERPFQGRSRGDTIPVLYGGSVKRGNVRTILSLPGYDGVLVGGASLDPAHFADIAAGAC